MQTSIAPKTFKAGAAPIPKYARVKLDANGDVVVAAGADTNSIGIVQRRALAVGEPVPVLAIYRGATQIMIASGVVAVGTRVETANGGKVGDEAVVTGGRVIGIAKTAAGADGDLIEVTPYISTA